MINVVAHRLDDYFYPSPAIPQVSHNFSTASSTQPTISQQSSSSHNDNNILNNSPNNHDNPSNTDGTLGRVVSGKLSFEETPFQITPYSGMEIGKMPSFVPQAPSDKAVTDTKIRVVFDNIAVTVENLPEQLKKLFRGMD